MSDEKKYDPKTVQVFLGDKEIEGLLAVTVHRSTSEKDADGRWKTLSPDEMRKAMVDRLDKSVEEMRSGAPEETINLVVPLPPPSTYEWKPCVCGTPAIDKCFRCGEPICDAHSRWIGPNKWNWACSDVGCDPREKYEPATKSPKEEA